MPITAPMPREEGELNIAAKSGTAPQTPFTGAAAQFLEHYRAALPHLPGAAGGQTRDMREAAAALLAVNGLPNRRVEAWKYTDLRALLRDAPPPVSAMPVVTRAEVDAALGPLAALAGPRLVFVNGHYASGLSRLDGMTGVEFLPTRQGLEHTPEWAAPAFRISSTPAGDTVSTLNELFAADGAMLHVMPGAKLIAPLHLVFLTAGDALTAAPRNLIAAGEGAEALIIESFISLGGTRAQTFAVTGVAAAKSAKIRHVKYAGENLQSQHFSNWDVTLAEAADYQAVHISSGASLSRHQLFMRFDGEGARGHFSGAQLLRERQHCDMTMVIDHAVPRCESREQVKAVLADEAHGVFQAKAIVRRGAQKTDGRQMARALLLSDAAEFDAKPELEIYADDVKCNHGSAIGQLDRNMLFYLRSRGIPEQVARAMLIEGFVAEVVETIENEPLRDAIGACVNGWLREIG
jgi:Fe-S cluster assembly protein SufD